MKELTERGEGKKFPWRANRKGVSNYCDLGESLRMAGDRRSLPVSGARMWGLAAE